MALEGKLFIYGLREITVKAGAGTPVKLPAAQTLSFNETLITGELRGNDVVVSQVSFTDKIEWEMESGGLSLEALAVMTGRTIALTGTGAAEVNTMTLRGGESYPWFEMRGRALTDSGGDVHVVLYKCRLTEGIKGEFADGEFFVQSCSGVAIDNGTKLADIVQNETAVALPIS